MRAAKTASVRTNLMRGLETLLKEETDAALDRFNSPTHRHGYNPNITGRPSIMRRFEALKRFNDRGAASGGLGELANRVRGCVSAPVCENRIGREIRLGRELVGRQKTALDYLSEREKVAEREKTAQ